MGRFRIAHFAIPVVFAVLAGCGGGDDTDDLCAAARVRYAQGLSSAATVERYCDD